MNDLCVFSLNARGMNSFEKRQKNYDWLRNAHIALIQETHYIDKIIIYWQNISCFFKFPLCAGCLSNVQHVDVDENPRW